MQDISGTALLYSGGLLDDIHAKTAHGLLRYSDRFQILGLIDPKFYGSMSADHVEHCKDNLEIYKDLSTALEELTQKPKYLVMGVAFGGGMLPEEHRSVVKDALRHGMDIVCGLHQLLSEDPELAELAVKNDANIHDIRRPKKAEEQRILYLEYLKEQNLFSNKKKAVVDIGYAGTMQEGLYKITNEKIAGYYLITFQKAVERIIKKGLIAKGFLGNFIDRHNTFHPFPKYVPLYETLFSTEETSFIKIIKKENKLVPIFAIESKKENIRKKIVKKNHEGAIEFINDTINIFEEDLKEIYIEANKVLKILDVYFKEPHPRDAEIFEGIVFEDNYGGAGIKTILPIKKEIHNNCVWKEGQKVLIKDINIRNNLKNDDYG
jgi:hypothetical protein